MFLEFADLHPQNFKLRYPFVRAFTTSPWLPMGPFILYRLIVGNYCLAWLIFSGPQNDNGKWFLYLSNWLFVLVTLHFLLGGVLSIIYVFSAEAKGYRMGAWRSESEPYIVGLSGEDDDDGLMTNRMWQNRLVKEDQLGLFHKVLWVIFTVASTGSLQLTLVYWSVIYDNSGINGYNVTFLILNSVFITMETLLSNLPVFFLHFFYSHAFQSIYILFTVVYWAAGGTGTFGTHYIYRVLDYEKEPAWAVLFVFLSLLLFQLLAHLYYMSLCNLRRWLVRKFN